LCCAPALLTGRLDALPDRLVEQPLVGYVFAVELLLGDLPARGAFAELNWVRMLSGGLITL
jgi:hypothetical protein